MHKAKGMVKDVFRTRNMRAAAGHRGSGSGALPHGGQCGQRRGGPAVYVNAPFGIVMAHNGNLTNARRLRHELFDTDHRHTQHRQRLRGAAQRAGARAGPRSDSGAAFDNARCFLPLCGRSTSAFKGSYAVVALIAGYGLLAFRDPMAFARWRLGRAPDGGTVMLASESVALEGTLHQLRARHCPGRSRVHPLRRPQSSASSAPTQPAATPACSSTSTWPARIR